MHLIKPSVLIRSTIVLCLLLSVLAGCKSKKQTVLTADPKFREVISAYTSGVISVQSTIKIRLANDYPDSVQPNTLISQALFDFSPSVKGNAYWVDRRTIEFRPDEKLKGGTIYTCKFFVSKILKVPADLKTFEFGFQTILQSFAVTVDGFKPYENTSLVWNKITGTMLTGDYMEPENIGKILSASQENRSLHIGWVQNNDGRGFNFTLDSVRRGEKESRVLIFWNGKPVDIDQVGGDTIVIPALGDFRIMQVNVVQEPTQFIRLLFSDPLLKNQNLDGLIRLNNNVSLTYAIGDNEVRVYPSTRQSGSLKLFLEEGIRNIMGYKFKEAQTYNLAFEDLKPAVRLVGKGVILPNSQGLVFPFEAVNLKAVDVKIIRIFENNVTQFLQVNQLDGENELKRVGRLILKKEVPLTSEKPIDYGTWNMFFLDLSQLIRQEPGAIYRVEIGFRKKQSLYPCTGQESTDNTEELQANPDEEYEQEVSYWDSYESYYDEGGEYYEYGENYNYSNRNDPCANEYYGQFRFVARNIFASNLGIIAKGGSDQSMTFAVTNLITTEPVSGVTLEIYNFQRQIVATASTNGDGLANVKLENKPFLLVAKKGDLKGYLKLDEGSSLSLSSFDVSGNAVHEGIKGFLYGERGVWRPGDTLFLTFILEDKQNLLPPNHPVILELINPRGQLVSRLLKTSGVNGFYSFITSTQADAPTGNWTANIRVGGTTFTKTLKIETIKPNRLKISLDFGKDKLSVLDKSISGLLKATWLHGAIAGNLKATISVTLNAITTSFPKYAEYTFDDPVRKFSSEEQNIFEGRLNEQGETHVSADISVSDAAPGMLQANFITRVFEESGDFSIDRFTIPYAPYESFVGIRVPKGDKRGMLLTDTMQTVQVVTVDPNGNPTSRSNLQAKVYKLRWRWWWDASGDDLASYIGSDYISPVASKEFNTSNGKGSFSFRINYPDWGRFLIQVTDPESGHTTGRIVYVDWPGWAGRNRENPGGAAILAFNSDKPKYTAGEEATITFPSPENARALVSIESGSRVLNAWWVNTTKNETKFSFKITGDMSPNVYVYLTMVQPHAQKNNDLPIRLYGVIPLLVENPQTHLQPEISMPDVLRPESKVKISVKEKSGRPMTYTIAMVDEGLLDLTRYKTPDPWDNFYAREALGVRTWDMYDLVLGAYGGKLQSLLSIGGDENAAAGGAKSKANRFKPVIRFLGPFFLDKGKTASHEVELPPYVGSVKTMVVAGNDGAYGSAEKATPVRKPLMILATLPRVLGPDETVQLPVTVFAMENNVKNVTITVTPNNLLIPEGALSKSITFSQTGDQIVNFSFKVARQLGVAKVKVVAKCSSESAQYDIELDVRNANPPATSFVDAVIEPGKSWDASYKMPGMTGTNKGILEVSCIPPIDFGRRLKYLLTYPHGCVEQTTSAAFPQIFLPQVMEMSSAEKLTAQKNVMAAIDRLRLFMVPDGGFGYWPGDRESNDWATSYAGHFLLEAEAKGYALPQGFKNNWLKYQRNAARNWTAGRGKYQYAAYQQSDLEQAYRLYTLSLAGQPELGAMNRLRERKDLSLQARWRLAAAYALAGQNEVATDLVNNAGIDIKPYSGFYSSYGSRERDWAMILETMTLMKARDKALDLVNNISKALGSNEWMSTQTTAYCLLAMSKFAGDQTTSKGLKFEYSIDGSKTVNGSSNLSVIQINMNSKDKTEGQARVTNKGNGVLFARITLTGIPEPGNEVAKENDLRINVLYTDMNDNPIEVSNLVQGTDFKAIVTVTNPGNLDYYKDLALSQVFPSGWEIHNSRMDQTGSADDSGVPTYQDFRDDRVYTYFDLARASSKKFTILLNAAYLGRFYLPAVSCEAMYDNRISASKPGQWVEVVNGQ